jgi:uncharacterized protein with GYD domain
MSTYNDASLIYYPSGYKASKAYSLKPTDGSGDLTFTRASTATRVNEQGLIEGVRTNLLTYSEQFDNAAWVKNINPSITINAATSPDGTTNADKLIPSTSVERQAIYQNNSSTGAVSMSVYAKKGEYDIVQLTDSRNPTAFANFDLTNGVLGSVSDYTATITSVGSGWYRCSISYNYTLSLSAFRISVQQLATSVRLPEWAGNGTSGIYIYGAQLELSASATEYIPTTTTAVSVGMLANVPRIDYTSGCGKLLLEPQRTNLVLRSEEFDNAAWTKTGVTITANNVISPDGYLNADKLVEDTSTGNHRIVNSAFAVSNGTAYSQSWYVKYFNNQWVQLNRGQEGVGYLNFDLINGVVGNTGGITNYEISVMSNGWYRISINYTVTGTYATAGISILKTNINARYESYVGDGTSGVYIWGCQYEQGSYSTSQLR